MKSVTYGQVVISKAGRDQGNYYIIVDLDEEYVYLSDGRYRRLDHLKKKRLKHIQPTNLVVEEIRTKIKQHLKLTNLEIRQALIEFSDFETPADQVVAKL